MHAENSHNNTAVLTEGAHGGYNRTDLRGEVEKSHRKRQVKDDRDPKLKGQQQEGH